MSIHTALQPKIPKHPVHTNTHKHIVLFHAVMVHAACGRLRKSLCSDTITILSQLSHTHTHTEQTLAEGPACIRSDSQSDSLPLASTFLNLSYPHFRLFSFYFQLFQIPNSSLLILSDWINLSSSLSPTLTSSHLSPLTQSSLPITTLIQHTGSWDSSKECLLGCRHIQWSTNFTPSLSYYFYGIL